MNKLKYFIYISSTNILFAGEGGGSWINDWLMPNTGLTLWTIVTFLVLLFVLKWQAWGPLMDALDARAKNIEASLSKAEEVSAQAEQQAAKNEEILQAARKEAENHQPIKRMGTTDEIANAIMFMSSDECNYMIGANIIVDGGITLRMHENDDTGAG